MRSASDFPAEGREPTTLLVVGDIDRSRSFNQDMLGATFGRRHRAKSMLAGLGFGADGLCGTFPPSIVRSG